MIGAAVHAQSAAASGPCELPALGSLPLAPSVVGDLELLSHQSFRLGRQQSDLDSLFLFEASEDANGAHAVSRPFQDNSSQSREELRKIYSLFLIASDNRPWTPEQLTAADLSPRGKLLLVSMISELRSIPLRSRLTDLGFSPVPGSDPLVFRDPENDKFYVLTGKSVIGTPHKDARKAQALALSVTGPRNPSAPNSLFAPSAARWVYSRIASEPTTIKPMSEIKLHLEAPNDGSRAVSASLGDLSAWHADSPPTAKPKVAVDAVVERREDPTPAEQRFADDFLERTTAADSMAALNGELPSKRARTGLSEQYDATLVKDGVQGTYKVVDGNNAARFQAETVLNPLTNQHRWAACVNDPYDPTNPDAVTRYCLERRQETPENFQQVVRIETGTGKSRDLSELELSAKAEVRYAETEGQFLSIGKVERAETKLSAHVARNASLPGLPANTRLFARAEVTKPAKADASETREGNVGTRFCMGRTDCLDLTYKVTETVSPASIASTKNNTSRDRTIGLVYTITW
ncbi:MAG: hypothetical protein NDJ90_00730 [Oligoflexia bacterium]|nr:hypothetical protein [Oligoflexia bacterium]